MVRLEDYAVKVFHRMLVALPQCGDVIESVSQLGGALGGGKSRC